MGERVNRTAMRLSAALPAHKLPDSLAGKRDRRTADLKHGDESISFKEFLLLIFHFYSTSCAIIRW
jgi:hypothetical protein